MLISVGCFTQSKTTELERLLYVTGLTKIKDSAFEHIYSINDYNVFMDHSTKGRGVVKYVSRAYLQAKEGKYAKWKYK